MLNPSTIDVIKDFTDLMGMVPLVIYDKIERE